MNGILEPQDKENLESWNFLRDYASNREHFIELARTVRTVANLSNALAPAPNRAFADLLTAALIAHNLFKKVCAEKAHLRIPLTPWFAESLARYIVSVDSEEIFKDG